MSLSTHFAMLQDKHHKLETMVAEESHRPEPDFGLLQTLKKQKLILKEELERLRQLSQKQHDAA
jgi:hypothetical protein